MATFCLGFVSIVIGTGSWIPGSQQCPTFIYQWFARQIQLAISLVQKFRVWSWSNIAGCDHQSLVRQDRSIFYSEKFEKFSPYMTLDKSLVAFQQLRIITSWIWKFLKNLFSLRNIQFRYNYHSPGCYSWRRIKLPTSYTNVSRVDSSSFLGNNSHRHYRNCCAPAFRQYSLCNLLWLITAN